MPQNQFLNWVLFGSGDTRKEKGNAKTAYPHPGGKFHAISLKKRMNWLHTAERKNALHAVQGGAENRWKLEEKKTRERKLFRNPEPRWGKVVLTGGHDKTTPPTKNRPRSETKAVRHREGIFLGARLETERKLVKTERGGDWGLTRFLNLETGLIASGSENKERKKNKRPMI